MVEVSIYPQAINANSLALMRAWLIHLGHRENATSWIAIDNIGPLLVVGNTKDQWDSDLFLPEWAVSKVVITKEQWDRALLNENKATDRSSLITDIKPAPLRLPEFATKEKAIQFIIEHCPCEKALAEQSAVCLRNKTKDYPISISSAADILFGGDKFINLNAVSITEDVMALVPPDILAGSGVIAFTATDKELHVAAKEPSRLIADKLRSRIGLNVVMYKAPSASIDDAIAHAGEATRGMQQGKAEESVRSVSMTIDPQHVNVDLKDIIDGEILLSHAIAQGILQRAKDIHIQPDTVNQTLIRFRIDRDMKTYAVLNAVQSERIFGRIKSVAEIRKAMHLEMSDAAMTVLYNGEEYDLRVGNIPVKGGFMSPLPSPCVTIRILAKQYKFQGLEDLGFSERDRRIIRSGIKQPVGMILVAGATSSGKSTTIFGMLNEIKTEKNTVMSIEDPVEYFQKLVKQTEVNELNEITPESYIPKALRHNPNILYAGETRDEAVARAGISATSSGHLYFSTIHANSATSAINRMIGVYSVPSPMLADYLQMVIYQKLVSRPCPRSMKMCRIGDLPYRDELLYEFSRHFPNRNLVNDDTEICDVEERDGVIAYRGETLVSEVLPISNVLRELIEKNASERELRIAAVKEGFWSIQQDALLKIRKGIITFSEFKRLGNPMWVEDLNLKDLNEETIR